MYTLAFARHSLQNGVVFTGTKENAQKLAEILDVEPKALLKTIFAKADEKQWFLPHNLAAVVPAFRDLMDNGTIVIDGSKEFIDHAEKGPNPRGTIYAHTSAHLSKSLG